MDDAPLPQGDLGLLDTEVARRLLASTVPARLAYVATDGTPRVLPVNFHWTGAELVVGTFAPSHKVRALRTNPHVAVTIDTAGPPPEVLLIRGPSSVGEVDGVVPEYALAMRRILGEEQASAYLAQLEQQATPMERVAIRPTWVGVLDFQSRFPQRMPHSIRS